MPTKTITASTRPALPLPPAGRGIGTPRHAGRWIAAAALLAAPLVVQGYELFMVSSVLLTAVALTGLNVLVGATGLLCLGQGALMALGAYVAAALVKHDVAPLALVPAAAGLACAVFGRLFGAVVLRLEGLSFGLATLALAMVVPQLMRYDALQPYTGGSQGLMFRRPPMPAWLGISEDTALYLLVAAHFAAITWLISRVLSGRSGRAMHAVHENPLAAAALGVDVAATKRYAFELAAGCAGVAGALTAILSQYVAPDTFAFLFSLTLFVGLVVGGIGAALGPLLGGVFLVLVPNFAEQVSQAATSAVYGAAVIAFIVIDRQGMAGLLNKGWHAVTRLARARTLSTGDKDQQP